MDDAPSSDPASPHSDLVLRLSAQLLKRQCFLATAESCTGGQIAAACTDLAGSSAWFDCGLVTYSNAAKIRLLGVDPGLIALHGAVSENVARAMAFGAVSNSKAQVAVAVTGVAGPSGGSPAKPVGTVWFGFMVQGQLSAEHQWFDPRSATDVRAFVRWSTVTYALRRLIEHTG
jgi:nicotinamide-nucleotide amidase